ncbi:hypothetical protein B5X24_HaOG210114 [Helicoverpa armigera]|uniref:Uncharacterized protein n=1 Tax=Helicoverpa armigera TaxID=29058 RepID=A0A2W1BN07_HELAM|nr:hypothetical protein B5X24_HaOG210114 [Helicoverpa armigera]
MSGSESESKGDGLLIITGILVVSFILLWVRILCCTRARIHISMREAQTQMHCQEGLRMCVIVEQRHVIRPRAYN